jgi:GDP-L-fucose synthase
VVPALIRKFHAAMVRGEPSVTIWGTGSPRRELLHVDDLADACLFLIERYDGEDHINVGTGEDLTIRELAETIRDLVAPGTAIELDTTKPDGTPRKRLDVSRLTALGWRPSIGLREGLEETYRWFAERWVERDDEARPVPAAAGEALRA